MPKQMVPFKADAELVELIDKLILVSQFGWTRTRYESRTELVLTATVQAARALLKELQADPELKPILDRTLKDHDLSLLENYANTHRSA